MPTEPRAAASRSGRSDAGWLAVLPGVSGGAGPGPWYDLLRKPAWTPPAWVFGPAWTLLYASMAVAAWLVWRHGGWKPNQGALSLFALQLLFNVMWSPLFFGMHRPGLALVDSMLIWLALLATIAAFWRVSVPAGALLLPYLAWVSFATALNFEIWRLNR